MIKIVEPDHRPVTLTPIADETCNCSCACSCPHADSATQVATKSPKSDPTSLPNIHGKRGGA